MSREIKNEPSTSKLSPPSPKRIKIEEDDEEEDPDYLEGVRVRNELIQTHFKQEIVPEEVNIKEESDDEVHRPSTSSAGTQTEALDEVREHKANEAVEKLLAQLLPKKKIVRGATVPATSNHVFQFLITLLRGKGVPRIWRRFRVPANYTFRQFHVAIQKVMGWKSAEIDYHLHAFKVLNPTTGYVDSIVISDDVALYSNSKDENVAKISDYFTFKNHKGRYEYDFGCGWQHEFVFESSFLPAAGESYPRCIEGAKACPPEDGVVHSDEEYDSDQFDADACF